MTRDHYGDAVDPAPFSLDFDESSHVLTVIGELDEITSAMLRDAIQKHSHHYAASIVIDLAGVEYLPSVAIGVLATSMQSAASQGQSVELRAAEGSIAQRVLQVCALPHVVG